MELYDPPPQSIEASPTFTGTVTMPDGATWATTGLADAASYSTVSTPMFSLTPTWTFTGAGTGGPITLGPTLIPSGASVTSPVGIFLPVHIGTSSANLTTPRGILHQFFVDAGYSGTITSAIGIQTTFANNGSNPIAGATAFLIGAPTNGSGNTSGTVTNQTLAVNGSGAANGAGGTIINESLQITLPSGSAASTTNYGLFITGNGGGASTNYALFSNSTAASQLAGPLNLTTDRAVVLTNQTSSAGAQVGTVTNAPTAGNPGFWLKISVGGVSYSVPCWAG